MSTRKAAIFLIAPLLLVACAMPPMPLMPQGTKAERYAIGKLATADEIRGWDIDVSPDGAGLPAGSGTVAEGLKVYAEKCVACHGANGSGGPGGRLTGGIGTLTSATPVRTVGSFWPYAPTVFDYVRRAMPWDRPLSLTPNEAYAVTAYILSVDKIVPENATLDAKTLPQVKMPNRSGFYPASNAPDVKGQRCMNDCVR